MGSRSSDSPKRRGVRSVALAAGDACHCAATATVSRQRDTGRMEKSPAPLRNFVILASRPFIRTSGQSGASLLKNSDPGLLYLFPEDAIGQSSVRNGEAGKPSLLKRLH